MAYRDWSTLRCFGPDAKSDPCGSDSPDDITPEGDEDCAEHVEGEEYREALPSIIVVCFSIALSPVVVYRDAICGHVSERVSKRNLMRRLTRSRQGGGA